MNNNIKIDIIFPYVDNNDPEWQKLYNENVINHIKENEKWYANSTGTIRFSKNDMLKYVFRGIEKNVPWVNKVHMIVQSESQIPDWLNTNEVNIIYHKDFIPEQFLPTFNSCTIEMFLHKINDLSENFIYGNDDFYFTSYININDFFVNDKLVYGIKTREFHPNWMWDYLRLHCQQLLGIETNEFVKDVQHIWTPHNKKLISQLFEMYEKEILDSISQFRMQKNYSQWLLSIYYQKINKCINKKLPYIKSILEDKVIKKHSLYDWTKYKGICLNDSSKPCSLKMKYIIINKFKLLFPNKSKYEL